MRIQVVRIVTQPEEGEIRAEARRFVQSLQDMGVLTWLEEVEIPLWKVNNNNDNTSKVESQKEKEV